MTDQSPLPGRTPQPTTPHQGARRVDQATLMRVRDSMRALDWTPHSFAGSSFIDIETTRTMAEEARLHD
jgi:hypothetical protein